MFARMIRAEVSLNSWQVLVAIDQSTSGFFYRFGGLKKTLFFLNKQIHIFTPVSSKQMAFRSSMLLPSG